MAIDHTTRVLGPADHGRLVSAEEYAVAERRRPWKYERVAGRLVVMPPDSEEHDDCSEPIRDHLGAYKLSHSGVIERVASEAWLRLEGVVDRVADVAMYLQATRPMPKRPERVPELVFEVVSPGRESRDRDDVEKRAEYHQRGVRESVVVDRFERTWTVFLHEPEGDCPSALAA